MLTYNYGTADSQILRGEQFPSTKFTKEYNPPIEEFSILQTTMKAGDVEEIPNLKGPSIVICVEGSGSIGSKNDQALPCTKGNIFFVPADTTTILTSLSSQFVVYRAFCELPLASL